jgi:hypothetical protein
MRNGKVRSTLTSRSNPNTLKGRRLHRRDARPLIFVRRRRCHCYRIWRDVLNKTGGFTNNKDATIYLYCKNQKTEKKLTSSYLALVMCSSSS